MRRMLAGRTWLSTPAFPENPDRTTYAYFVNMQGANGTYRQIIFIRARWHRLETTVYLALLRRKFWSQSVIS